MLCADSNTHISRPPLPQTLAGNGISRLLLLPNSSEINWSSVNGGNGGNRPTNSDNDSDSNRNRNGINNSNSLVIVTVMVSVCLTVAGKRWLSCASFSYLEMQ